MLTIKFVDVAGLLLHKQKISRALALSIISISLSTTLALGETVAVQMASGSAHPIAVPISHYIRFSHANLIWPCSIPLALAKRIFDAKYIGKLALRKTAMPIVRIATVA